MLSSVLGGDTGDLVSFADGVAQLHPRTGLPGGPGLCVFFLFPWCSFWGKGHWPEKHLRMVPDLPAPGLEGLMSSFRPVRPGLARGPLGRTPGGRYYDDMLA